MMRWIVLLPACLLACGCVNVYRNIDGMPDSTGIVAFNGLKHHLRDGESVHLLQIHGMGDHTAESDCGAGSENILLQEEIAERLVLKRIDSYGSAGATPIYIDGTLAGTYATHLYQSNVYKDTRLYISCVTWSEASRTIKQSVLELDERFDELGPNAKHRAPVNRWAKRFVNEKFSDPMIYAGRFGAFIRETVWRGLVAVNATHDERRARSGLIATAGEDGGVLSMPTVVISDSLGSRVVFDVLRWKRDPDGIAETSSAEKGIARKAEASIRSIYMFANQLPLIELANVPPPQAGQSLGDTIKDCHYPLWQISRTELRAEPVELVAFTDANDALSYHLSGGYASRCASNDLRIVNVTLPNARLRWLFLYSSLAKAHTGFKKNARAIEYLVEGNGR